MRVDTNRTRLVRKARPTNSFFNFFSPPQPPSDEAIESGDLDEDELEELEEKLEIDYQLGEDLKEKVRWPGLHSCAHPLTRCTDHPACNRLLHRQGARVRGL